MRTAGYDAGLATRGYLVREEEFFTINNFRIIIIFTCDWLMIDNSNLFYSTIQLISSEEDNLMRDTVETSMFISILFIISSSFSLNFYFYFYYMYSHSNHDEFCCFPSGNRECI